ncbi:hypothetical protein GW17_00009318 [Ensete ventricosum]|nr:hypothetical protein GW17_00009318 [Ensete ventricosum]
MVNTHARRRGHMMNGIMALLSCALSCRVDMVISCSCGVPHLMRFACFPGKVIVLPREVESPLVEVTSPLISYIASISHALPFELSDLVSQLARLPLPFSHSRPIKSERPLLPYSLLSVSLLPLLLRSLHLGRRNAILAAPRGVSLDLRVRPWV